MILITGATGQVGGEAVSALVEAGAAVRSLVRNPSNTQELRGVQVVHGSFEDDASLSRALDGVEVMLLAGRDGPDSVSQQQRVLAHVRRANVKHIVKLSAIGASSNSPVALMRDHNTIDEEIQNGSASWTLLKPHLYMQNLLRAADAIRGDGQLAAPMGINRFPLVDTLDVGAAAAVVLGNPAGHSGRTYLLTGPVAHSYDEVATELAVVAERAVAYESVSPDAYKARLMEAGIPDWRAFDLAHIASAYNPSDNEVSPDLQLLLGRNPQSLSEFLQGHGHVFTGVGPPPTSG